MTRQREIQITDLRRFRQVLDTESSLYFAAYDPVSESDLLSALTDEAKAASCSTEKLIGELVKRGVLTENAAGYYRQLKRVREMKQTAPPREGRPGIAARVDDDNTETE